MEGILKMRHEMFGSWRKTRTFSWPSTLTRRATLL